MARIDAIFKLVKEYGASDLHVTTGAPPMVRVHGEIQLIPYEELTREVNELLLFEIMDSATRARYEEVKDVDFSYEVPGVVRVRCNIYEQSKGVAGAFRVLPNAIPTLEQLGLPSSLTSLLTLQRGLIVVTGPPGSGKSSTLAALIDHINRSQRKHILTIEDPIEYRHQNHRSLVTQREVGRNTPSMAQALQAALREDPDVIMVGGIRDTETLALTLTAASTGQLVLSTQHTMSAAQAVDRIVDSFGGDRQTQMRQMLSESLRAVIAQRLLPTADRRGRALALEILIGNSAVAGLLREKKSFQLPTVMQTGKRDGMRLMDDSVLALVREGIVDPADAAPHLTSKDLMNEDKAPDNEVRAEAA